MKSEIDLAKEAGAAGVVFGLLTPENKIDETNTLVLVEYAHPLPVTFHKAIDEMENPVEGVSVLKEIGGIQASTDIRRKANCIGRTGNNTKND
jgi:copper homeostasis protein